MQQCTKRAQKADDLMNVYDASKEIFLVEPRIIFPKKMPIDPSCTCGQTAGQLWPRNRYENGRLILLMLNKRERHR